MLVKPLWPIAEYIINYDYIVTYLCEKRSQPELQCDGKCYLSKMIAEQNGQEDDNPFENQRLNNEWVELVYFPPEGEYDFVMLDINYKQNLDRFLIQKVIPPVITQPSPPPESQV